jgi:hypothetical protein
MPFRVLIVGGRHFTNDPLLPTPVNRVGALR